MGCLLSEPSEERDVGSGDAEQGSASFESRAASGTSARLSSRPKLVFFSAVSWIYNFKIVIYIQTEDRVKR